MLFAGLLVGSPSFVGAQPANDECTSAEVIGALPVVFSFPIPEDATGTAIVGCDSDADVWYSFAATAPTDLLIDCAGISGVSAYVVAGGSIGICPDEGDRVACSVESAVIPLEPGDLLFLQLHDPGDFGGSYLEVGHHPDRCVSAEVVETLPFSSFVEFPIHTAESSGIVCTSVADAWYIVRPDETIDVAFGRESLTFAGEIALFELPAPWSGGCPPDASMVVCGTTLSEWTLSGGNEYWFRVSMPQTPGSGDWCRFELDRIDPLENDECEQAIPLPIPGYGLVEMLSATSSAVINPCPMAADVWYTLSPVVDALVEVYSPAYGSLVTITVYESGPDCPGAMVACGIQECAFDAVAGQEYIVQVGDTAPGVLEGAVARYLTIPGGDARYRFRVPTQHVQEGEITTMELRYLALGTLLGEPEAAQGLSFAVCVEPSEVWIHSASLGADALVIHGGTSPDFYTIDHEPEGVRGSLVVDFFGQHSLPIDADVSLFEFVVEPLVAPGNSIDFTFCDDTLGFPPFTNIVTIAGQGNSPLLLDGALIIDPPPMFRRGDANADGGVDIADPVEILQKLFVQEAEPFDCASAADANDDEIVNIGDAVILLHHLFVGNPPTLPEPLCGPDPTAGPLGCKEEASCP